MIGNTLDSMFVGTQMMSVPVLEKGAEATLDEMRELTPINTVLAWAHTISALMYRKDHTTDERTGKPIDELHSRIDPQYYEGTLMTPQPLEDSAFAGRDILDELIAAGEPRGVDIYARILECYRLIDYNKELSPTAQCNQDDEPNEQPCFNHPEYLRWVLADWENVIRLHPGLKGLKYGQERGGPLMSALRGEDAACFCEHCQQKARDEYHFDLNRARPGWRKLKALGQAAANGEPRPADGWMASVLRIFMRWPEVLAHHRMWQESREDHRRAIYKLGKSINPDLQIGWHIDHHWCWDLFGRAALDFADMTPHSDWLSIALYFDAAGPRMAGHFSGGAGPCFLGDLPEEQGLEVYRRFAGQDPAQEPSLAEMREGAPLSAEHVYAETKRAVARAGGKSKVYARVGFDLPNYQRVLEPADVELAVKRALEAGADGVFLTREYHEVRRENLIAAAKAIRDFTA